VAYVLSEAAGDRCQQPAPRYSTAERGAIDLDLEQPVLLAVTVSVHYCPACQHYFRVQPPFLRPDAIYTNRVVDKAVQSVHRDGMALRRVSQRLAADFWVQPSEGMIRAWCTTYGKTFDFAKDYQPWVLREFSGTPSACVLTKSTRVTWHCCWPSTQARPMAIDWSATNWRRAT